MRSLRVDQIGPWADSLGLKVGIVVWEPTEPRMAGLDAAELRVLEEVAATLPHLPFQAREALMAQMKVWRGAR
jgi:hypothetical protein